MRPYLVLAAIVQASGRSCRRGNFIDERAPPPVILTAMTATPAIALVALALALAASGARADDRCPGALQDDVCLEATGSCPATPPPLGLAPSAWPVFQHDVQHTGRSPHDGPTCPDVLWTRKLAGKILSAPALGGPDEGGALFVAAAKFPLCALDPTTGTVRWCDTDQQGKLPDVSSPALGNGGLAYVGTRDNDFWAVDVPPLAASSATVAWRQKICTDGDVSTSPIIDADGVVFMGSNSLAGGTVMAMCPGVERRVKWCVNPLGGTMRNVSPALSPTRDRLYVTYLGAFLAALDPATGDVLWRIRLQAPRNNLRSPNYTPVVHPVTGRIYVGLDTGLYAIDASGAPETPVATALFPTRETTRERIQAPPALDVARGRLYFGASRGNTSTLYAVTLDGTLVWQRTDLGRGRFRNTPPVIDASGRVYAVLGKSVYALDPGDGHTLWRLDAPSKIAASPIVAPGRLYLGTGDSTVMAIGDCA
jgi:outer membrane protein assembly factor BamB